MLLQAIGATKPINSITIKQNVSATVRQITQTTGSMLDRTGTKYIVMYQCLQQDLNLSSP
jgi:hypothetical protein